MSDVISKISDLNHFQAVFTLLSLLRDTGGKEQEGNAGVVYLSWDKGCETLAFPFLQSPNIIPPMDPSVYNEIFPVQISTPWFQLRLREFSA